jgi:hypothetical protein
MTKRGDVADPSEQPDRRERVDAAQTTQPADRRRPWAVGGLLGQQPSSRSGRGNGDS